MARVLKKTDKKQNPGLAKLPKKVRNKMGYMAKGGEISKPSSMKMRKKGPNKSQHSKSPTLEKVKIIESKGGETIYGTESQKKKLSTAPKPKKKDLGSLYGTYDAFAEGGEMPAPGGDRYSRKRKRKARRQRRGKKQRGSCRGGSCPSFKHGGKMKCTC